MGRVAIWLGLGLSFVLFAQNTDTIYVPSGFMTGEEYLGLSPQSRAAYAAGFFNGLTVASGVTKDTPGKVDPSWLSDCSKGMTNSQIAEILRKDIRDRPSEWHRGLNMLSLTAMLSACKEYRISKPSEKR
jgi:hypothetical protein